MSYLAHIAAGTHITVLVLACVELLHASGKLPVSWQLVRLMEELDICQHGHCCVHVTAAFCVRLLLAESHLTASTTTQLGVCCYVLPAQLQLATAAMPCCLTQMCLAGIIKACTY